MIGCGMLVIGRLGGLIRMMVLTVLVLSLLLIGMGTLMGGFLSSMLLVLLVLFVMIGLVMAFMGQSIRANKQQRADDTQSDGWFHEGILSVST